MMIYALAARLNKTCAEIEAMDYSEFMGWFAFLELKPS